MPSKTKSRTRKRRNLDPLSAMSLAQTTGADKALLGRKGFAALADKRTYLGRGHNPTAGKYIIASGVDDSHGFGRVSVDVYRPDGSLVDTWREESQALSADQLWEKYGRRALKSLKSTYGITDVRMPQQWRQRHNPEDVELNDMPPAPSLGHIEFTPDGIERYVRDGYVYQAFANTPVFGDGYRMGAIEGAFAADEYRLLQHHAEHEALHAASQVVQQSNPAKYERCVKDVQASARQSGRPVNAYAVCTAQGLRNPHHAEGQYLGTDGNFEYWEWHGQVYRNRADNSGRGYMIDPVTGVALLDGDTGGIPSGVRSEGSIDHFNRYIKDTLKNPKRRKRNPADTADSVYEEFHGTPPSETLEYREQLRVHGHLAGLGDLVHIVVKLTAGTKAGSQLQLNAPDPSRAEVSDIVRLTSNEDKSQLYFTGGDQSLDLKALGFRESFTINHDGESFDATDFKDLMEIGRIVRVMYRTEKEFDDFEVVDYHHLHGEDTKKYPLLLYDNMNSKMLTAGGEYAIEDVGIVN